MAPTPHANDENTPNGSGGSSSSSSYYGGGGGSLDNLSKLPDSNTIRHQQHYYRPTSPSAPSSVEEAIRAVDSLLASDDDDDDATTVYTSSSDVSEDSSLDSSTDIMIGSSLLHHMSLLPTFNSRGNFTSYEKRQLKQEIEERNSTATTATNNNTLRLESSPYGFHFDKDKAAKKSRLGSSIIDQPLELNTKQSTAMNEFLDNPDSQSWDELVASMKKERKKKTKTKKKKRRKSSSRHLAVGGGSSPRRKTRDGLLAGLPVVDETSVMSDVDYGCGLPNTVFEEDDEDEYDEEKNGGRAEEETVDFTTPSEEQTTNEQEGGQEMSVSSSGYSPDDYHDEEYGDLEEIDFHPPPTCRSPTFNYSDGHHSLPPTRPCNDAIYIVQKKKKTKKTSYSNKRGIIKKCAISITLLILLAGIVGGVMIAFKNRTIAVNSESDSSSNSATAAAVVEESSEDTSSYYQGPKGHNVHQDTAPSVDDEEEEEPWIWSSSSKSSSNSSSSHSTGPKGFTVDGKGEVHIKPTALSTIKSIKPTSTNGGETLISVSDNGDTHISFLRFDISTASDDNERIIISKATLHLHMTTHEKNIENDATITLEALPNAGIWDEELISWDNPVQTNGSYVVSTFDIKTLSDGGSKEHTEVVLDITKAVVDSNDDDESSVTLKLSTNAHEKIDFASYKFKSGSLVPELVLTLSE